MAKKPRKITVTDDISIEIVNTSDLVLDDKNANLGTVRGRAMLEDSLSEDGAGRPVLLDKDRRAVAGNKTIETAVDKGFDQVVIIHSKGKQLIAHQRDDIDLDTPQGRRMAIADNRIAQVDLNFDPDIMREFDEAGYLEGLFDEDEIAAITQAVPTLDELEARHGGGKEDDLYVNISLKVSPDTRTTFMNLFENLMGDTDEDKVLEIIERLRAE